MATVVVGLSLAVASLDGFGADGGDVAEGVDCGALSGADGAGKDDLVVAGAVRPHREAF